VTSTSMVDLYRKPGTWCQGPFALNNMGHPRTWSDPDAVSYCIYAALNLIYGHSPEAKEEANRRLHHALGRPVSAVHGAIIEYNEEPGRTQDEILALCEKAQV